MFCMQPCIMSYYFHHLTAKQLLAGFYNSALILLNQVKYSTGTFGGFTCLACSTKASCEDEM